MISPASLGLILRFNDHFEPKQSIFADYIFFFSLNRNCLDFGEFLSVPSLNPPPSQVLPPRAGEGPAEPPPAAPPGAAGAAGGALLHPAGLPERAPLAQPLREGAHQAAAGALGEPHHRHHHHAPEEPAEGVRLRVGGRLTEGEDLITFIPPEEEEEGVATRAGKPELLRISRHHVSIPDPLQSPNTCPSREERPPCFYLNAPF